MNSSTRYILTATAVGAGLFTVGATANAIAGTSPTNPAPIGDPVVVPSNSPTSSSNSSGLEEVNIPATDVLIPTPVFDTGGWATSPGGPSGDDDDNDDADDDGPDSGDDHGVEIENESEDD